MALQHALSTNNYGAAHLIVANSAANGTHTTLTAAMADAVSGDTIILRDSVTEDVTLTAGVNIASWQGGTLNTPTITGKLSMTTAGTCNISGIRLASNGAEFLSVTGSAASIVNLTNCFLTTAFDPGITFSSSSASALISITNCTGDITVAAKKFFAHSSSGTLNLIYCQINNTIGSTTASTCSAGVLNLVNGLFSSPITMSGTGAITIDFQQCNTTAINTTALTLGGSGAQNVINSFISSGTASAISISTTATVTNSTIISSNTNAITGAGTLQYTGLNFTGSNAINTTTITRLVMDAGSYKGQNTNTAIPTGMIGEQITSFNAGGGSSITLSNGVSANVTSINLTAGIWNVSALGGLNGTLTGTAVAFAISATSATLPGTEGSAEIHSPTMSTAGSNIGFAIPPIRVSLSAASTTYYLVANCTFSGGTAKAFGSISAYRVA